MKQVGMLQGSLPLWIELNESNKPVSDGSEGWDRCVAAVGWNNLALLSRRWRFLSLLTRNSAHPSQWLIVLLCSIDCCMASLAFYFFFSLIERVSESVVLSVSPLLLFFHLGGCHGKRTDGVPPPFPSLGPLLHAKSLFDQRGHKFTIQEEPAEVIISLSTWWRELMHYYVWWWA